MAVETPSLFARVIQDHLELKRRNPELEGAMPKRLSIDDPFDNQPLFKTEEQARLEETMDGDEPAVSVEAAAPFGPERNPSSTSGGVVQRRARKRLLASGRSHATSSRGDLRSPQLHLLLRPRHFSRTAACVRCCSLLPAGSRPEPGRETPPAGCRTTFQLTRGDPADSGTADTASRCCVSRKEEQRALGKPFF